MNWQWEQLTGPEFAAAVKACGGVCVVPLGVIEKHGDHLPLGQDVLAVHGLAVKAAGQASALVFPPYYFGQIHEAKHWPGTVAIRMRLALELLENVCEEIGRNGFAKIVIMNGHGGNGAFLGHFMRALLEEPRDYQVYLMDLKHYMSPVLEDPEWKAQSATAFDHHGGETETSGALSMYPDLVRMDAIPEDPDYGQAQKRLDHLPWGATPVDWYANFPNHYAGDARPATREKGEWLVDRYAAKAADFIRAVKDDTRAKALQDEFFSRIRHR